MAQFAAWLRATFGIKAILQDLARYLLLAAVSVGGSAALGYAKRLPVSLQIAFGVCLFLVLAAVVAELSKRRLTKRPHSPPDQPHVHFTWVGGDVRTKHLKDRKIPIRFVHVGVTNDPPGRNPIARVDAAGVRLAFYPGGRLPQADEQPVLETQGLWAPTHRPDMATIMPLLPNNEIQRIAVAYQHEGEDWFYGASPEMWQNWNFRIPNDKLDGKEYCVEVRVAGMNLREDLVGHFRIRCPGPNLPLELDELPT